jgi:hypothetical protein
VVIPSGAGPTVANSLILPMFSTCGVNSISHDGCGPLCRVWWARCRRCDGQYPRHTDSGAKRHWHHPRREAELRGMTQ